VLVFARLGTWHANSSTFGMTTASLMSIFSLKGSPMLVLTRKIHEQIRIGSDVTVTIVRVHGNKVQIGVEAPRQVRVVRGELPRSQAGPCLVETRGVTNGAA
jgi:carbon storage regulator CsrA